MALSGRGGLGGLGGGMGGGFWHQQRSLGYLRADAPHVRRTLRRVWRCLRPYRGQLALGTVVMLAGVGLGLVPPLLIRALIDIALPRHAAAPVRAVPAPVHGPVRLRGRKQRGVRGSRRGRDTG